MKITRLFELSQYKNIEGYLTSTELNNLGIEYGETITVYSNDSRNRKDLTFEEIRETFKDKIKNFKKSGYVIKKIKKTNCIEMAKLRKQTKLERLSQIKKEVKPYRNAYLALQKINLDLIEMKGI